MQRFAWDESSIHNTRKKIKRIPNLAISREMFDLVIGLLDMLIMLLLLSIAAVILGFFLDHSKRKKRIYSFTKPGRFDPLISNIHLISLVVRNA